MPNAPTQTTPFPVRMPPELRDRLEARARSNGRSVNSEVLAMVAAALDTTSAVALISTDDLVAAVVQRLNASVHIVVPDTRDELVKSVPAAPKPRAKRK